MDGGPHGAPRSLVFPPVNLSRPGSSARARRPSSGDLTAAYCLRLEAAYERGFRDVISLQPRLRSLPLLVRCAIRVHQQRETRPVLVFTLDEDSGRTVVVAQGQGVVLLFSRHGALDAAGDLIEAPDAPVFLGEASTHIEWTDDVGRHDWY